VNPFGIVTRRRVDSETSRHSLQDQQEFTERKGRDMATKRRAINKAKGRRPLPASLSPPAARPEICVLFIQQPPQEYLTISNPQNIPRIGEELQIWSNEFFGTVKNVAHFYVDQGSGLVAHQVYVTVG
jgi:hypothetical protein